MFAHLCSTCGNVAEKIKADFEHVCHICHEKITGIRDLISGDMVEPDAPDPVPDTETVKDPVPETVTDPVPETAVDGSAH